MALIEAHAQSKSETINWIISKFNKWKAFDREETIFPKDSYSSINIETPISLTITNCLLVFKSKYVTSSTPTSYDLITRSLNIGDLENVEWVKYENKDHLILSTAKSMVKIISISRSNYECENSKSENTTEYFDRIVMVFNTNGEDDLKPRLLKAFNHLRSFCKQTPKVKEVF